MADARIEFEGQTVKLPEDIANDDAKLRAALVTVYPSMSTAELHRTREDGVLVVTAVKRAGTKGTSCAHGVLQAAPAYANPALGLATELAGLERGGKLDADVLLRRSGEIERAIERADEDCRAVDAARAALRGASPVAARSVPAGSIDDADEAGAFRLFGVLGGLPDSAEMALRIGVHGHFFPIPLATLFEVTPCADRT